MRKLTLVFIVILTFMLIIESVPLFLFPVFYDIALQLMLYTSAAIVLAIIAYATLSFIKLEHLYAQLKKINKHIYEKLFMQKNLFESMFENSTTGAALLNLDGTFVRTNKTLRELFGYREEEILEKNFCTFIQKQDANYLYQEIKKLIYQPRGIYSYEQACDKKNGDKIWIRSNFTLIKDQKNEPVYFLMQTQNITSQKEAEERLRQMAYHDPLTGLANRNKLEQFINHTLASAHRHGQGFALLFLDLDRFKNINDTIGHEAGDELLQIIGNRLQKSVRATDLVARPGGDEFVLVITDIERTDTVAMIAQKILDNVLQAMMIKGQEIYITISVGISLFPFDGESLQSLMKNADLALYRAKEHGRNNYQFYTIEMTSRAIEKMSLQNALGHALVKNEFVLHYQPKMAFETRRITGIEALLRWKNEKYNMITPDEIIALAEETGLIIPVSMWVLKTACQQLQQWHKQGFKNITIAVNCSSRQFKQANFVEETLSTLEQYGIHPSCLEIEIKESTILNDPENTLHALYTLKNFGVQIAIDDFGTGYWSLNILRRLAVDKIKIDKTFIRQIAHDETSVAVIKAMLAMMNKLNIKSVAEGVETREQYEFLHREGCTEIQGYYLTHPLPADDMTYFLKHPIPDAEAIHR